MSFVFILFREMLPFKFISQFSLSDSFGIVSAHCILYRNNVSEEYETMIVHNVHLLITCMFLYFIYEHCTAACETIERPKSTGDSSMMLESNYSNTIHALQLHNKYDAI